MNIEMAAQNPGACRVLQALLERHLSSGDKARPIRLDAKRMPEFGRQARQGEADGAWEAIRTLEDAGLIRIDPIKTKPGQAAYEMLPLVRLVSTEAQRAAELIGFALEKDPWTKEWIAACSAATWLSKELQQMLGGRPHRIGNRSAAEIFACWQRLVDPALNAAYIREASATAFWSLSKVLDDRLALVNAVRQSAGLVPLLEAPILINAHLVEDGFSAGVLFIENQSTFEAARRGRIPGARPMHLVYSAGFKASAARVRREETASLYLSDSSSAAEIERFRKWLFSDDQFTPTYFWGDLDYAALSILRSLKGVFHELQAWEPGYIALVDALRRGHGHLPEEDSRKGDQKPIGATGCRYADTELLPALRDSGRFIDQETCSPRGRG